MLYEINLPQSVKMNVSSKRKVIRLHQMKDIAGIKSAIDSTVAFYGKNTEAIYVQLNALEDLKSIHNLRYKGIGIIYDLKESELAVLSTYAALFKEYNVTVVIDTLNSDKLVSAIKELTKYDVEVEISSALLLSLDAKAWDTLAKEVITNPKIVQRVEPLFSMAYYLYQKRRGQETQATLWKVTGDEVSNRLYVDDKENVTLSKRWADEKRYFGNLNDKENDIQASEFYKKLDNYEQDLFFTNMDCSMCSHYGYCKAYLKFENSSYDCSGFKNALDFVEENFDTFKTDSKELATA